MLASRDQTTGIIERVIYGMVMFGLSKLVARGYIDGEMAAYIAGGVVTFAGGAYAWWINRPNALVAAVSNIPNPDAADGRTVVVTADAIAKSTPATNVVSSQAVEVVGK